MSGRRVEAGMLVGKKRRGLWSALGVLVGFLVAILAGRWANNLASSRGGSLPRFVEILVVLAVWVVVSLAWETVLRRGRGAQG